jgi:hypothetical protein
VSALGALSALWHLSAEAITAAARAASSLGAQNTARHIGELYDEACGRAADALADREAEQEVDGPRAIVGCVEEDPRCPSLCLSCERSDRLDRIARLVEDLDTDYRLDRIAAPLEDIRNLLQHNTSAAAQTTGHTEVAAESPSGPELRAHSPEGRLTRDDLMDAARAANIRAATFPTPAWGKHWTDLALRLEEAAIFAPPK